MVTKIKVTGIQMAPVILEKQKNLETCVAGIEFAAKQGSQLVIFPEATLTGYVYKSLAEAVPLAEPVPGPSISKIVDRCREFKMHVVVGLIEEDRDKYYNTSVLLGPSGIIGKYRKLHLPYIGVDRFLNHGDRPPRVYDTDLGRIGLGICYDMNFPEHSRVLTLLGAEVIIVITNWPEGIEFAPQHLIYARAIENHVHYLVVNRAGEERGVKFIGRSKFVDCTGKLLGEAKPYDVDVLSAEFDPTLARDKYEIMKPGEFESDSLKDRRPEMYGALTEPLDDISRIR